MKQLIKEQLITALTSGEYEQGEGSLRQGDRYCVLGVLCDIYRKETNAGTWKLVGIGLYEFITTNPKTGVSAYPSPIVTEWAGLTPNETNSLQLMNDADSFTFQQIAEKLQSEL